MAAAQFTHAGTGFLRGEGSGGHKPLGDALSSKKYTNRTNKHSSSSQTHCQAQLYIPNSEIWLRPRDPRAHCILAAMLINVQRCQCFVPLFNFSTFYNHNVISPRISQPEPNPKIQTTELKPAELIPDRQISAHPPNPHTPRHSILKTQHKLPSGSGFGVTAISLRGLCRLSQN